MSKSLFAGSGPGAQAKDGCSVEVYRRQPYMGELEAIVPYLAPACRVLELGCGAGRLTRRLLELGCEVTAVDNSADMLRWVPEEAVRVEADIEHLDLGRRFEIVLLPTGLINHADVAVRGAFLHAAARHVSREGRFLLQRQDPQWLRTAKVGRVAASHGLAVNVEAVSRRGNIVSMTVCYAAGADSWRHTFQVAALEDVDVERELAAAGFLAVSWLDAARRWACAT